MSCIVYTKNICGRHGDNKLSYAFRFAQINCLEYALFFWEEQPKYRIYYNSDHVINLPGNSICDGFLPIEEFGYEHLLSSFTLSDQAKEILKEYFK